MSIAGLSVIVWLYRINVITACHKLHAIYSSEGKRTRFTLPAGTKDGSRGHIVHFLKFVYHFVKETVCQ